VLLLSLTMSIWAIVLLATRGPEYLSPFFTRKLFGWLVELQTPYAAYPLIGFVVLMTGLFLGPVCVLLTA